MLEFIRTRKYSVAVCYGQRDVPTGPVVGDEVVDCVGGGDGAGNAVGVGWGGEFGCWVWGRGVSDLF